jgi:hypothetical protein
MVLLGVAQCADAGPAQPCTNATTSVANNLTECHEMSRLDHIEDGFLATSLAAEMQPDVPTVSVSVYNMADVSGEVLSGAQAQVTEILDQAGIQALWLNCLHATEAQNKECYLADSHHVLLKILPHAIAHGVRDRVDVLGTALLDDGVGFYAYVFYDRVLERSQERRLESRLLACVMAHEIGHLLLGSSKHSLSGIMSGHWGADELRKVAEGAMRFDSNQSRAMHAHLGSLESTEARRKEGVRIPLTESKFPPTLADGNGSSELR